VPPKPNRDRREMMIAFLRGGPIVIWMEADCLGAAGGLGAAVILNPDVVNTARKA
jgi:hypothetical protein